MCETVESGTQQIILSNTCTSSTFTLIIDTVITEKVEYMFNYSMI